MVVSLVQFLLLKIICHTTLVCCITIIQEHPLNTMMTNDGTGGSGTQGMEFLEWYGSVGLSGLPYDLGISYYFGYSPTGFAQNFDYTYHNVSAEIPVPSTPFTLYGGVGWTDSDTASTPTGYGFTDYLVGVSTSAFGLDWGVQYTTTTDYAGTGVDADTTAGGDHVVGFVSASF